MYNVFIIRCFIERQDSQAHVTHPIGVTLCDTISEYLPIQLIENLPSLSFRYDIPTIMFIFNFSMDLLYNNRT